MTQHIETNMPTSTNGQNAPQESKTEDYITIIGATFDEVMESYRAQRLADKHYALVHRIGRHSFTISQDSAVTTLFNGVPMVAATFARMA